MIVAIQGVRGSFSDEAAREFVPDASLLSCEDFDALFAAVASGAAARGVVPVHNTTAGFVYNNEARAAAEPFVIIDRTRRRIRHCLIARHHAEVAAIRRVASHPMALRQCAGFFAANRHREAVAVADTASGVRDLMDGRLDVDAVIGSLAAAQLYGATVVREGVEDRPDNATDFVFIARHEGMRGVDSIVRRS